jgi:predicted chitinase
VGTITETIIRKIAPLGRSDLVSAVVRGWPRAEAAGINTRLRAAHFLAQICTETGGLQILSESGAYSAKRIVEIFGVGHHSAKVTQVEAERIAALPTVQRGPVLFDRVYGPGNPTKAREFNNLEPGDGWKYRGGGMMQATGKSNYAALARKTWMPLVEHPGLLHQPDSAFQAAYLEWSQDNRCNAAADRDDVVAVRRIINGGTNGISETRAYLAKAKAALANYDSGAPASPPADAAVPHDQRGEAIRSVQLALDGMGYHEVGLIDGKWGGKTAAAIAAFMNDRHLTGAPVIDDDLLHEIGMARTEEWSRPMAPERVAAPEALVAANAPEIVPVQRGRLAALAATGTSVLGVVTSALGEYFQDALTWVSSLKEHAAGVPGWFWWAAAGGVAMLMWYFSSQGAKGIVDAFRRGERS